MFYNQSVLDVELSLTIAQHLDAKDKQCWSRALQAFLLIPDLQTGWYAEGWAILPERADLRLPLEHGWIERGDGRINDSTWVLLGNKTIKYFPGNRYSYTEASKRAQGKKSVQLPLLSENDADPLAHPAYRQAFETAYQALTGFPPSDTECLLKAYFYSKIGRSPIYEVDLPVLVEKFRALRSS
jgi:hypothetical protein